jgi:glucosamine kinase
MADIKLIIDSGSTKAECCLLYNGNKKTIKIKGISPYFLNTEQMSEVFSKELYPKIKNNLPNKIFYYGTGCAAQKNRISVEKALQTVFENAVIEVEHDLIGAARAVCGHSKGVASILGTGSNSCYFDGKKIKKNSPGLGYVLGDEGSGAYLGKKVIQYYLYGTFDEELNYIFEKKYQTSAAEILENVYKKPLPNRYLAGFTLFLVENRGHFMVENIIEDGLNDFFFTHLNSYKESLTLPVHFIGSVAYGFKDVIRALCEVYDFKMGKVLKTPMQGLIEFHK